MNSPTPEEIKSAREKAGLLLKNCAELVHIHITNWQKYEAGVTKMHPSMWELFLIKTGQLKVKKMK